MQPGSYTLSRALSNEEIINVFSVGRKSKTITFPEGYTVRDVAAKLEKESILPADTFINACQNYKDKYKFLKGVDIKKFKLEGFLFPATYQISENATNKDIVELFLKGFATNFKQENYAILKEYIVRDCNGQPDIILLASGSEVHLALEAACLLPEKKIRVRYFRIHASALHYRKGRTGLAYFVDTGRGC